VSDTDLRRAVERFVGQVGHWESARWAAGGRADRTRALVQRLADAAADAEGRSRRVVPRLADPVLPDQVKVLAADLLAAAPPAEVLAAAVADLTELRRGL
jgi:hypothetical protein